MCWGNLKSFASRTLSRLRTYFLEDSIDILNHDFWDEEGGKISPLQKNSEAFSGDDFWSMLSGIDGTGTSILEAFAELSDENFAEEFEEIFSID